MWLITIFARLVNFKMINAAVAASYLYFHDQEILSAKSIRSEKTT